MSLISERQLFEYRIVRMLGQGAVGSVYLAHDILLDRQVAIKELTTGALAESAAIQRFLQEARAVGGINHPNVVTVYALKILEPNLYLIMEHVDGGSLRARIDECGPLAIEEAVHIAADVCDGLASAHAKGIIHRDIKPENVLLTRNNRAKVSDFGIAHVPIDHGGLVVTEIGFQPGTILYMSPEQLLGHQVDDRCDVYQVGVLLYEMLTGQHPVNVEALKRQARKSVSFNTMLFRARFYELLAKAVCEEIPEDVRQVRSTAPDWVASVITAAMSKQASERPSAEEVARTLRERKPIRWSGRITHSEKPASKAKNHLDRGVTLRKESRWRESVHELQTVLQINPACAEAHYNLGLIYQQQGQLDEAVRELQATLRINVDHADARSSIGKVYYMQGRLDDAIEELQSALRVDPGCAEAHATLGMVYGFQGKTDLAVYEYQTALAIYPDEGQWHYVLGTLYGDQGHPDALRELQTAAHLGFEPAQYIVAKLKAMM